MSLFSKLFGSPGDADRGGERIELLQRGYKETMDGLIFPPDTVWAGSQSKVYHSTDGLGCSGYLPENVEPIPEAEAVRRGLHRCKRCEWPVSSVPPKPASRPLPLARPVSGVRR